MGTLLIIKTGTKIPSLQDHPGDYEHWIGRGMDWPLANMVTVDMQAGDPLPDPGGLTAVAITGSGSMVTEQTSWMLRAADWLTDAVDRGVPVLGICFGHQLLAWALGGEVGYNPRGIEVGTTTVTLGDDASQDPVFSGASTHPIPGPGESQPVRPYPASGVGAAGLE